MNGGVGATLVGPGAESGPGPHPRVRPLPALTSLRFVAAMLVLAFHYAGLFFGADAQAGPIGLGYSGVTFFFVLSGFILAYNYHAVDLWAPGTLRLYLLARVARVYPVFLFALLLHLPFFLRALPRVELPLHALMLSSVVLSPLGVQAWVPGAACALNCPTWSISVEVFFYALFPVLLPAVLRRPGLWAALAGAWWLALGVAYAGLWDRVGPGLSVVTLVDPGPAAELASQLIKFLPPNHLPSFVWGIALFALWRRRGGDVPVRPLIAAAGFLAALLVAARAMVPEPMMHDGLTALAWAPLILAGAATRGGPLCAGPAMFLGRASFCLYLLHAPVGYLVTVLDRRALGGAMGGAPWVIAAVAAGTAVLLAGLLHAFGEEPARRAIMRRWGGRPARRNGVTEPAQ